MIWTKFFSRPFVVENGLRNSSSPVVFADERIVNFSELHSKFYCVSIDSGDSTKNVFIFSPLMQMPTI